MDDAALVAGMAPMVEKLVEASTVTAMAGVPRVVTRVGVRV